VEFKKNICIAAVHAYATISKAISSFFLTLRSKG
jgi:hypothetical protein